jgi:protein involved in polysaccharide export with SLBB domain
MQLKPRDRIIIPFGLLEVYISGEVQEGEWVTLDALSRLSTLVEDRTTPYSSLRDIKVTGADGAEKTYDLFRAARFGDIGQDPYLKSGDKVSVERAARTVSVEGEVERPGSYQLLPGDDLHDLVDYYGGGVTVYGNIRSIEVIRYQLENHEPARTYYVDMTVTPETPFSLEDMDSVTVHTKLENLPSVTFEGAVSPEGALDTGVNLEASNRVHYSFEEGELLSRALFNLQDRFSAVSDLENAYIIRQDGSMVAVDMEAMLYRFDLSDDIPLERYDRIIIPFKQFFVIVSGAVLSPGRYPYIPDRTYDYYVELAGGFDPDRHIGNRVRILDIGGEPLGSEDFISPEAKIYAPNNNPFYILGKTATIVSAASSIVAVILAIVGQ